MTMHTAAAVSSHAVLHPCFYLCMLLTAFVLYMSRANQGTRSAILHFQKDIRQWKVRCLQRKKVCDSYWQGRLVAMDIHKKRLGALKTAAAAQGLQNLITTRTGDLCQYAAWVAAKQEKEQQEHLYDRVLVDAPCSGLGVLAKR